jgi:hypothetical protein
LLRKTTLEKHKGAGNAGCPLHPQPRVHCEKAHERSHHRFTGNIQHSLRNGFNGLFRALPGDRAFLPPSFSQDFSRQNLTPASGRQDHTALPYAENVNRPARYAHLTLPRPSHPAPNVRDDRAYAPLIKAGRPDSVPLICPTAQAKYFSQEGWTAFSQNCPSGKSVEAPPQCGQHCDQDAGI